MHVTWMCWLVCIKRILHWPGIMTKMMKPAQSSIRWQLIWFNLILTFLHCYQSKQIQQSAAKPHPKIAPLHQLKHIMKWYTTKHSCDSIYQQHALCKMTLTAAIQCGFITLVNRILQLTRCNMLMLHNDLFNMVCKLFCVIYITISAIAHWMRKKQNVYWI